MASQVLKSDNPANGELLGELPIISQEEIQRMVANAHEAEKKWAKHSLDKQVSIVTDTYREVSPYQAGISLIL